MLVLKMDKFYGEVFKNVFSVVTEDLERLSELHDDPWLCNGWNEWCDLNEFNPLESPIGWIPDYLVFKDLDQLESIYWDIKGVGAVIYGELDKDPYRWQVLSYSFHLWLLHKMRVLKASKDRN